MESGLVRQTALVLLVSTVTMSSGMCSGWMSPMTSKLQMFDSPIGRMTQREISYLAILPHYVGIFLALFYGVVAKKFGRKNALVAVGVPSIASGLILTSSESKIALYVARCLAGCTMIGGAMTSFMYVSETVNVSVRGTLMAVLVLQFNLGIILSYVLGDILTYHTFNSIGIAVPVAYSILILWLPESPHFLLTQGRVKDALHSLMWLRNGDLVAAKKQLELIKPDRKPENNPNFVQTLRSRGSRTALVVCLLACIHQVMCGNYAILSYSQFLMKPTEISTGPVNSSTIIVLLLSVAILFNIFLIDTVGRKILLFTSFTGCCISLTALSCFLYLKPPEKETQVKDFGWISITCVSAFVVSYSAGLATVPSVLTNELPTANVKPTISAVIASIIEVVLIIIIWSFPYLVDSVGLYFVFAISSAFNFIGIFFTWYMVPETIGKSQNAIARELRGERVLSLNAEIRV